MAQSEYGQVQSPPPSSGAAALGDEPETVWKGRCVLDRASREIVEQSPIMCIENGKLKVDLDAISAHECGSAVRTLLEKFKESLVKKNIPVTRGSERFCPERSKIQKMGQIFVRLSDTGGTPDCDDRNPPAKRPIDQAAETATQATPHASPCSSNGNESNGESPRSKYARRVEVVRVPSGVCAGDRLGVFDSTAPPSTFIDIPSDAYPDMRLDFERPATPVKYLLLDGNGYKVGGNFMRQHAVRLTTHRGICKRLRCPVMGCHGDKSSMLFKRLGQGDDAADYHRHWSSTSRESLRSHGLHFRMLASRVSGSLALQVMPPYGLRDRQSPAKAAEARDDAKAVKTISKSPGAAKTPKAPEVHKAPEVPSAGKAPASAKAAKAANTPASAKAAKAAKTPASAQSARPDPSKLLKNLLADKSLFDVQVLLMGKRIIAKDGTPFIVTGVLHGSDTTLNAKKGLRLWDFHLTCDHAEAAEWDPKERSRVYSGPKMLDYALE